jgi:PAS domain S-box-containing protein
MQSPGRPAGSHAIRFSPLVFTVVLGLLVSGLAFGLARWQEKLRARTEFVRRADIHQATLHSSLISHLESFQSVQKLFQTVSNVSPELFQAWASEIVRTRPEIQVIEWCPRITGSEREAFEAAGQRLHGSAFRVVDRLNRTNFPAPPRAEYYPILYYEPVRGNEIVAGFDVAAGRAGRELATARDTGQPVASGRIPMAQDVGEQYGLIVTLPVYAQGTPLGTVEQRRAACRGVVRGVFRIGDLLSAAWRSVPVVGIDTLILDPSAPPDNRVISFHAANGRSRSEVSEAEFRAGEHYESSLRVGARTWTLLFRPVPPWWNAQFSWLPFLILVGGIGATLLAAGYVRSIMRRAEVVERTVAERTEDLRREVAERTRTEEQLRKTQGTLVLAQRIGRVGSWEVDLARNTLAWSEETYRIFGRPLDQPPTNDSFYASVHPEDRAAVRQAVTVALETGRRYDVEHRVIRPDGVQVYVHEMAEIVRDDAGQPVRMVGTVQDVTERRLAEERIQWEHKLLRTVIDTLPDYIFFKDRSGRFLMNNVAARKVHGEYTPEDFIGKTDADFLPKEIAMQYLADDARVMETGEPILNREEPFVTRTGERRLLLTTKIPLKDARGQVTGIVGVSRDITERKRLEEERQAMERKFQETQKLESLGVLAGGIAHDFNNLLTGILGNASLARMELPPESGLHSYLEQIENSSQRAADLCKQMLAYSGKGRFIIQRIDVTGLVKETLHLLQLSISKKAVLKLHLAEKLPAVMADATQLRQIVMNLVINASDAIGDRSGLITISTSVVTADHRYLGELIGAPELHPGDYVCLEVTDNGCGMSPEVKAKIFEPFFTTKFTGRGLGLAAVLGIVRGHRGAMKVYSEPGRGSTFKLLLPAAGAPSTEAKPDRHDSPQWRGSGTVLVVDDEESVRMVASRMLRMLGFDVLTANNGEQALHVFRTAGDRVSAVLLDLTMPKMDGEETFRELRRLQSNLCVILMSGFNEQEAGARFVGKGLAGFLQKPFTPEELRERLRAFGRPIQAEAPKS